MVFACVRQNSRQVRPVRPGAGSRPARHRMFHTVAADTLCPRPTSSPRIRRWQSGSPIARGIRGHSAANTIRSVGSSPGRVMTPQHRYLVPQQQQIDVLRRLATTTRHNEPEHSPPNRVDLIIIPLLLIYAKYHGARMAWFLFGTFNITMSAAGYVIEFVFAPSARCLPVRDTPTSATPVSGGTTPPC